MDTSPRHAAALSAADASVRARLSVLAARWRSDLLTNIVPFWLNHSLDEEHGGYFTALDRDGSVLDESKFVWLQGRAVWTWSRLHNELRSEVPADESEKWWRAARCGARFLKHGKDSATGNIWFAVSRDGSRPLHFQRKPYAAVFHVLGCLEYAECLRVRAAAGLDVDGDDPAPWLAEAVEYFERLCQWIDEPHTLGRPPVAGAGPSPDGDGASSLADVMCLAGLSEELLAKLPAQRERWLAHVEKAQARVAAHFDDERGVLLEQANARSGVCFDDAPGRVLNPGHSIEVAWFLLHLCRLRPNEELQRLALRALEGSLRLGWDEQHGGGIVYMLDVLGKPLMDCTVTAEHKLWWPLCEALYACTLALEWSGEVSWLDWLEKIDAFIYEHLCDAEHGGEWFGYLRPDGSVFNFCKGGNYKGFFHVPRALLFSTRAAERYLASDVRTTGPVCGDD